MGGRRQAEVRRGLPGGLRVLPVAEAGRLYLQAGGREDHRFAALDAKGGELLWTSKGVALAVNASPVAADLAGGRQVLSPHSEEGRRSGLTAFDPRDGTVLWSIPIAEAFSFDTPFALRGDRVGLQTIKELRVLKVERRNRSWSASPLWRTADLQSAVNPPVLHAGHLFGWSGDDLACVEAESGRTAWKQRIYPGSLILVDGHLVVLSTGEWLGRSWHGSSHRVPPLCENDWDCRALLNLCVASRQLAARASAAWPSRSGWVRAETGIGVTALLPPLSP